MKTILLQTRLHHDALALLNRGFHVAGPMIDDSPERRAALAQAQALILSGFWQIDDAVMAQAPLLEVIGRPGIGVDNVDLEAATRRGICVVNTPEAPTQSTAEHALALLLALSKGLVRSERGFKARGFQTRNDFHGVELKGKTLGLVGLGRIGRTLARSASAGLQMRVIAYDPFADAATAKSTGVELKQSVPEVLSESDFISLHCALTPQTRGLIGRDAFKLMKPTAFLINCSRGPVIDEPALIEALRTKTIAGAGLDVFSPEPPEPDNPLFELENVIVTPHIASHTNECANVMHVAAAEEVAAALKGERPRWLANPGVWEKRRR